MNLSLLALQLLTVSSDTIAEKKEMEIKEAQMRECIRAKTCHSVWDESARVWVIVQGPKAGSDAQ